MTLRVLAESIPRSSDRCAAAPQALALALGFVLLQAPPVPALDLDRDGYHRGESSREHPRWGDCDDRDPSVHPGSWDRSVDGADQDCDGLDGPAVDRWGGWTGMSLGSSGYFRVEEVEGRWWLVTPAGHPFFSTGVNAISFQGDYSPTRDRWPYWENNLERYGTDDAWRQELFRRYQEWGLNTVGSWSEFSTLGDSLAYTVILNLSGASWEEGDIPDYFAPEFETRCDEIASDQCEPRNDDPDLIGWFLDNELRWGPDYRRLQFLFDDYMELEPAAPGKIALVDFLERFHGGEIDALNAFWRSDLSAFDEVHDVESLGQGTPAQSEAKEEFLLEAATRYYEVTTAAVRYYDPNHLVLGERLQAQLTHDEVLRASAPFVDVVSVNRYRLNAPAQITVRLADELLFGTHLFVEGYGWFEQFHDLTGRPIMHTEFGYRALDSGMPNTWPPIYPTLLTQACRADWFERDARRSIRSRWVVGYHWFKHSDQPFFGRFDGEDNNFGLVDLHDEPYRALVRRMAEVNRWWRLPEAR